MLQTKEAQRSPCPLALLLVSKGLTVQKGQASPEKQMGMSQKAGLGKSRCRPRKNDLRKHLAWGGRLRQFALN